MFITIRIEVKTFNSKFSLLREKKNEKMLNDISINSKMLNILLENGTFNSAEFIEQFKFYKNFAVAFQYPSNNFDSKLEILSSIKSNQLPQMIVILVINEIIELEKSFKNNTIIDILKIQSVNKINPKIFKRCVNLKVVNIQSDITEIPRKLFYECKNLKKVTFPSSLLTINT